MGTSRWGRGERLAPTVTPLLTGRLQPACAAPARPICTSRVRATGLPGLDAAALRAVRAVLSSPFVRGLVPPFVNLRLPPPPSCVAPAATKQEAPSSAHTRKAWRSICRRTGDEAPDFTAETTEGPDRRSTTGRASRGRFLFSHSQEISRRCTTELGAAVRRSKPRVRQAQHEGHRPQRRSADDRHRDVDRAISRTSPGRRVNFPDASPIHDRTVAESLRHDPPERQRHDDGSLRLHRRARQQGQADPDVSGEHGPQLR